MTMPVILEVLDPNVTEDDFEEVFDFLNSVDKRFSVFKFDSEISKYNRNEIPEEKISHDLKEILKQSQEMKNKTDGFFDIEVEGKLDPTGLVKGWAIYKASQILRKKGFKNFYVEIAGDIELAGLNEENKKWAIGIRNPFNKNENVKVIYLSDRGVATSGTYEQGEHIYNPKNKKKANEIASLTVIGPNVYEADCFATACFAMGKKGIEFIESTENFEGYMIDHSGVATFTSGLEKYLK